MKLRGRIVANRVAAARDCAPAVSDFAHAGERRPKVRNAPSPSSTTSRTSARRSPSPCGARATRSRSIRTGSTAWNVFERRACPTSSSSTSSCRGMDGLELCRRLRAKSQALPIVFVTSKDDELDRVLGPRARRGRLSLQALLGARARRARACAAASPRAPRRRRPRGRRTDDEKVLRRGALVLDLQRYSARWNGAPVPLTVTEFLLLKALAAHPATSRRGGSSWRRATRRTRTSASARSTATSSGCARSSSTSRPASTRSRRSTGWATAIAKRGDADA